MSSSNNTGGVIAVTLRRWRVFEVVAKNGARTRHVWGHDVENDDGRVSGPVVEFKLETMTATTSSGTHYRLAGLPGHSRKGQALWEKWRELHEVVSERDVTNEYMDADDVSTRQFVALNDTAFFGKPPR